jgi:hypothetical protein
MSGNNLLRGTAFVKVGPGMRIEGVTHRDSQSKNLTESFGDYHFCIVFLSHSGFSQHKQ